MNSTSWVSASGEAITKALSGRHITFDSGATQHFRDDGTTTYVDHGGATEGGWRLQDGRFCSVWPPSTRWDCYDVELSADGKQVRFVAGGSVFAGTFNDA